MSEKVKGALYEFIRVVVAAAAGFLSSLLS